MFALYDIFLILSAAASVGFFFGRISTVDCVLQVMLTQDWFMELGKWRVEIFLYQPFIFFGSVYICKYRCATNIYQVNA